MLIFAVLGMDNLEMWLIFTIPTVTAIVVAILAQLFIVPWQRKKIIRLTTEKNNENEKEKEISSNNISVNTVSTTSLEYPSIQDPEKVIQADNDVKEETDEKVNTLFNFLQILSAIFSSFAHGGNDVRYDVRKQVKIRGTERKLYILSQQ